jgi:5-methylcytosine-specific restriction endonuclease McrA
MKTVISNPVLVLNRNWQPIHVCTVKRAMKLVANEYNCGTPKARVINCDDESFQMMDWADWAELLPRDADEGLRSMNLIFRVPEVIALSRYDGYPINKVHFSRRMLYKRDHFECQYCGEKPKTSELTLDHVMPKSRGGKTTFDNCVLACVTCNFKKADRTPKEAHMKLRRKPKRPQHNLLKGDYRIKSWEQFLGAAYWMAEMPNDEKY